MVENFPFEQVVDEGKIIRTFHENVDDHELQWHQDLKDRTVTILKSDGWEFQMDNELPNKMNVGDKIFIPNFAWHRVIKGNGDLVVSIEEH
jgi:hypothetical protein